MKKILSNPELNYFTLEEEQKIRNHFKGIARKAFEHDYENLKENNRLKGIKKNIEKIKELDTLMDLEVVIKQQITQLP